MFELDLRSRLPIYEQLVEKLKSLIVANVLTANEQLPSVRQLAQQLTINPNTIQKAYRELEQQGYIYSLPGKGSFVAPIKAQLNIEKITTMTNILEGLIAEALFLGMTAESLHELIDAAHRNRKGDDSDV